MKKVILIFAHKDVYLLNAQIEQFLSDNNTDIYIHLDKKSEKLSNNIIRSEHVFLIKNNVSVKWGDDTMMRALFASFDEIANNGRIYDWFIITTGQDLIIQKGLDDFLQAKKNHIFLDAKDDRKNFSILLTHRIPNWLCDDSYSLPLYHPKRLLMSIYFRAMKYGIIPKKNIGYDYSTLKFYYSFNWSVMPYEVFKYCADFLKNTPEYKELYYDTLLPEDGFLATFIMNSKYAKQVVWGNKEWSKTLTFHDSFKVHPRILSMKDIDDMSKSGCFFARKFDSTVDKEVIDYYKHLILNK